VIQQLAQNNPHLAQTLAANPEALFNLLNEGLADHEDQDGEGDVPPGAQRVSVTAEEMAAIERVSCLVMSKIIPLLTGASLAGGARIPPSSRY
jgi:UV excision repair protein RAD23